MTRTFPSTSSSGFRSLPAALGMPAWPQSLHRTVSKYFGEQAALLAQTAVAFAGAGVLCSVVCPAVLGAALLDREGRAIDVVRRHFWSKGILYWCGVGVSISGAYEEHGDEHPCVYVANHQSYFDVPATHLFLPANLRMVSKRALMWVPFLGWSMWAAGYPSVDRSNSEDAHKRFDKLAEQMKAGMSILIFAEGTRTHDGEVGPFKKGAFVLALKAGVPIVPVGIAGSFEANDRRTGLVKPGHIYVHVGPEIVTRDLGFDDRDRLRDEVREAVLAAKAEAERRRREA